MDGGGFNVERERDTACDVWSNTIKAILFILKRQTITYLMQSIGRAENPIPEKRTRRNQPTNAIKPIAYTGNET